MNIIRIFTTSLLLILLTGGCASTNFIGRKSIPLPPGTLGAAEVTALFSGKTVSSVLDKSGRVSLTYYNPNGALRQLQKGGNREGAWRVRKDGRICLQFAGKGKSCRIIVQDGNVYQKYIVKRDGNHQRIITYTSFRNGDLVGR